MSPLVLSGVSYTVGERSPRTLLDGIDLEFRPGVLTALSGPSGSGKTTLLSIAGGLVEPTTGTTSYEGASMWGGTGDPRPEVAFVLQVYGLVPILSARENVSVALRARGMSPAEADERAESSLARFHIADLGDRQVEELSGGQMQRVALARGLCVDSGVLLADEPTSELDEGNRGLVLRELRQEAERGAVVVVATHDPAVVDACDRHFVLDEGRLVDHVAPVDAHRLGATLTRPDRVVVEEARPPKLELDAPEPADVEPVEHVAASQYVGRHSGSEQYRTNEPEPSERVDPDAPFKRPSDG
jgi:putative ABC transport system ATP-binding protein